MPLRYTGPSYLSSPQPALSVLFDNISVNCSVFGQHCPKTGRWQVTLEKPHSFINSHLRPPPPFGTTIAFPPDGKHRDHIDPKEKTLTPKKFELSCLRQRCCLQGAHVLSDAELLALLTAWDSKPSPDAHSLAQLGGLHGLLRREALQLAKLPGWGKVKACTLKAAAELGKRLAAPEPPADKPIHSPSDVAHWFRCRLQDKERECFHALLLDSRNRPLRDLQVTEGTWTSCPVDPKVVFSACLRHGAPAVILVHNHPSGDPTPSRDDLELTDRMLRAGKVIGVRVLDHLIVGREGFISLSESGLM